MPATTRDLIMAATKQELPDLVFKNAKVVDVFNRGIIAADVAVTGERIVGLGRYSGKREVDIRGCFLLPSFTDAHIHFESSMLTPGEYARLAVARGTTAVIADPHEIANVCGEDGLDYMLRCAEGIPFDVHFMLPSCVPATGFEHSGAVIDSAMTHRLMEKYPFYGLGEMMNAPGVINADEEVLGKLASAERIDGHAPMVTGSNLCGYLCAGIMTDHEVGDPEEMLEKISMGMYIQIREGTSAKNLAQLLPAVTPYNMNRVMFCTDDFHIDDLADRGSIANCVAKAVGLGMDPLDAITIAALNPALCYGLRHRGAIAPGYLADIIISRDLTCQEIEEVYHHGVLAAKDGKALFSASKPSPQRVSDTVKLPDLSEETFMYEFSPEMPVIQVLPHSLVTKKVFRQSADGLNLCAVIERHGGCGSVGRGFVDSFSVKNGAIAQSIGHDSHNVIVIGDNPHDMYLAVQALGKGGGIAVAMNGTATAMMPLPIAGLMSDKTAEEVLAEYRALCTAAGRLDCNSQIDPFMMLSFLPLPVIPELKLTDSGVFDVNLQQFYGNL